MCLSNGARMPTETYNFRRKLKKLQQDSSVTVEEVRRESDDIRSAIETFAQVHGQRWKSLGYPSAFDDPVHKEFHVEFSRKFSSRGWLRLSILRVSGAAVAVSYNFHYKNRVYMYHNNAYGPDSIMKCSPGFIIRSIAMADGIKEGMEIFDYLRGDEAYKYLEGKTINSRSYLIRATCLKGFRIIRLAVFLIHEFFSKSLQRLRREHYEFRRYRITSKPSFSHVLRYLALKVKELARMGMRFIVFTYPFRQSDTKTALH
jgi:CelD/BcsL family acetyltransferase involved in cellulose biosynthesis